MRDLRVHILWLLLISCGLINCGTLHAQINYAARYEIDAKRIGVNPYGKDGLPRSREFIRLDSTYYVGYLFEGLYKYNRASDYLGYRQALAPLQKAMRLMEKDFGPNLSKLFSSIDYFIRNQNLFGDYYELNNVLRGCYSTLEMPDSAMAVVDRTEAYRFQRDFFSVGSQRAWLYHRYRFFTSEKFAFLKNSIAENEKAAYEECYKQLSLIGKNEQINNLWYGNHAQADRLVVYHYLAILHDYNHQYDSSEYYYRKLMEGDRISWGNYACMLHEVGNLRKASENFSKYLDRGGSSLEESYFYLPMMYMHAGRVKDALQLTQEKIASSGSVPGFGWYNIALARSYLYDGQLDSCEFILNKAANFKELHIGTTLTQSQYDFTINLLKVQLIDKKMSRIKFFNTGWWYWPGDLFNMCVLKIEKMLLEYALVNAMSGNPERDKIVYDLFCSETTIMYDESLYLLRDFSPAYFEQLYSRYEAEDKRGRVNRYFRLFKARFAMQQGKHQQAIEEAQALYDETLAGGGEDSELEETEASKNRCDYAYEKLFAYRLNEMLAQLNEDGNQFARFRDLSYRCFPQLLPFSGLSGRFNLTVSADLDDEVLKEVMEELKDCNIEITDDPAAVNAWIEFVKSGDTYQARLSVSDEKQTYVSENSLIFKTAEGVGRELALRLFGKGGPVKFEAESKSPEPKKPS